MSYQLKQFVASAGGCRQLGRRNLLTGARAGCAKKKCVRITNALTYVDLLWALWISLDGVDEMHQLTLDIIRFVFVPDVSFC